MTDNELLKLAAIAAGIKPDTSKCNGGGMNNTGFDINGSIVTDWHNGLTWNPLKDDGDAFRLAVRLRLTISFASIGAENEIYVQPPIFRPIFEPISGSIEAATRRAIVRAAAEMGKALD